MNAKSWGWVLLGIVVFIALIVGMVKVAALKPALPIDVTFRAAALGQGYVATLRNEADKHLTFWVRFRNETLRSSDERVLSLKPFETVEVGWMEGWKFLSGDMIELYHADYQISAYKVR